MTIRHYAHTGIQSATSLGEYYRRFRLILQYLIDSGCLSVQEQSRSFFQGLGPPLEEPVRQRLQQKFIDNHPDDPYPLSAIFEAACFVLVRAMSTTPAQLRRASELCSTSRKRDPTAATIDALTSTVTSLGNMFLAVLQTQQMESGPQSAKAAASGPITADSSPRNFCDTPDHFTSDCKAAGQLIQEAKCKRNQRGIIILPSGAAVPRSTPGPQLYNRTEEYHWRNPGKKSAQMRITPAPTATIFMQETADQRARRRLVQQADWLRLQRSDPPTNTAHPRAGEAITIQPSQRSVSPSPYKVFSDSSSEAAAQAHHVGI
jgi:hypothetical protein